MCLSHTISKNTSPTISKSNLWVAELKEHQEKIIIKKFKIWYGLSVVDTNVSLSSLGCVLDKARVSYLDGYSVTLNFAIQPYSQFSQVFI